MDGNEHLRQCTFAESFKLNEYDGVGSLLGGGGGGGGGYLRNFFLGMSRWEPGTLSLIPELDQLNFATLY